MHIIIGKETAEQVRQHHIVLELETFDMGGKQTTAYCVVQAEKIIHEMPDIDRYQRIHQALIDALNRGDYSTVTEGITHLYGKFGGELDSFYDVLTARIKELNE